MIRALCGGPRAVRFVFLSFFVITLVGCASVETRLHRATEAELRGDYTAALSAYEAAIPRIPESDHTARAATYVKVGECYWRLQHPTEAMKAFEQAALDDPANVTAHLRMAEMLTAPAPDRAVGEARAALALAPNNA